MKISLRRNSCRRLRRDERGLTTLEWLLIVAAVAGLAALAVVLVQTVVDDTAEQIGGSSARRTAAEVAAAAVIDEAKTADITDSRHDTAAKWAVYFADRCKRIEITYSDAGIGITADFVAMTTAANYTAANLLTADDTTATATKPKAVCTVT